MARARAAAIDDVGARGNRRDAERLNFLEWTGCHISFVDVPDGFEVGARWAVHDSKGHTIIGNGRTLREAIDDADQHYVARAPVPRGSH